MADKICNMRSDTLGFLMNMSNVNSQSKVLLVESTKGFMTGAVAERFPAYLLRVEFGQESMKCNNEVLAQFDFNSEKMLRVGYVNAKLLVQTGDKPDPFLDAMKAQYKKNFSSFIFVHDELHPMEVWQALKTYL